MRFANIRELKLETNKVLKKSKINGPVVITRNGNPIALLRIISENDLTCKIGSLWKGLRQAAERAGYGPADVEKLIKESRASK